MSIYSLYKSSLEFLERGEFILARNNYEKILEQAPNVKNIHYLMGIAFLEYNQLEDALAAFSKALINDEDVKAKIYFQMAAIFLEMDFFKRAIKFMDKSLEIEPDYFDAQFNLAMVLSITGQNNKAIKAYERALEINPNSYASYTNLGMEFQYKNNIEKSITYYKKALECNSFYPLAWYNLACAYALKKDVQKSLQALKKAIRLDEEYKEDARYEPDLEILASSPIFQGLIR